MVIFICCILGLVIDGVTGAVIGLSVGLAISD